MAKRRTFTPDFKLEAVLDMMRGEKTIAQICRERDITESLLYKWCDLKNKNVFKQPINV